MKIICNNLIQDKMLDCNIAEGNPDVRISRH